MAADPPDALRALGDAPAEARVHRSPLARGGTTVDEVAKRFQLSRRASQRVLSAFQKKGLAMQSPEQSPRFSAVPSAVAADVLMARRHSELHHARAAMVQLRESADGKRKEHRSDQRTIEIVSHQVAAQMFVRSMASARTEILCLERMPGPASMLGTLDQQYVDCVARGVRCRSIIDSELLNLTGTLKRLRAASVAGEECRSFPSLPFKLVVLDRRIGIMPLCPVETGRLRSFGALVILA